MSSTTGCPSDETFTRLVEGLLAEDEMRALEAHCDGCLTCARTLAELARAISPSGGAGSGLLGDRYRLLEPLGAGGMGVVYAAFDTKLSRKVAVKRLRETGVGTPAEKRRGRFLREAQLLASLSHPNVLTVHDVGGADRELYVVMELVDGASVSGWLVATRPRWRAILDVFLQAGRGLVAAHALGIVHRDIKPDNILVAKNGRVLVGDFGLAGLAGNLTPAGDATPENAAAAPSSLTQTGTVLGTPAYMSPEQHDGKPGDALSDQFSFAVSLYESLHGRRPFAGRTASEIATATRSGQLAPGGDGVPHALDRVLSTALQPDPGRRFASMEDLLRALERAAAARPAVGWAIGAIGLLLLAAGAFGVRGRLHHGATPSMTVAPPTAAAKTTAAKAEKPEAAPLKPADGTAPPPVVPTGPTPTKHRKQVAQGALPAQAGQVPAIVTQAQLLARAEHHLHRREGAACLAALGEHVGEWSEEVAPRAQTDRGNCELLVGHCAEGKKLLEPSYLNNRTYAPNAAEGLLSAQVARMCPAASFPTVEKRVLAVSLQASLASSDAANQSAWCGSLQRTLIADTQSAEVQGCFAKIAATRQATKECSLLLHDLDEAYRFVTECFLRDKNCREGARLDVMHSQVGFRAIAVDDKRVNLFCRPERIVEVYTTCAAAGEEAERKCLDHIEDARRAGDAMVTPAFPR